jgi:hypothetical protein
MAYAYHLMWLNFKEKKMSNSGLLGTVFTISMFFMTFTANASLISRLDGQAVYDTDLGITWMTDVNLAATNTFGISGIINPGGNMSWDTAAQWIVALNATNYLGFNDWRLPTTVNPDPTCIGSVNTSSGFNCTGSEMGHLFYNELGGTGGTSILASGNSNVSLFSNITTSGGQHWSGTEVSLGSGSAWAFGIEGTGGAGQQVRAIKGNHFSVLLVRDGDVGVVPIPAAIWLFGSGLIGLIGIAKRKKV